VQEDELLIYLLCFNTPKGRRPSITFIRESCKRSTGDGFNTPKGWYLFLTEKMDPGKNFCVCGFNAPKGWYLFLTLSLKEPKQTERMRVSMPWRVEGLLTLNNSS
jgi:hypothetical protein